MLITTQTHFSLYCFIREEKYECVFNVEEEDVKLIKYLEFDDKVDFLSPLFSLCTKRDPLALLIFSAVEDRYIHIQRFSSAIIDLKSWSDKIGVILSEGVLKIFKYNGNLTILHSVSIINGLNIDWDSKLFTYAFDLGADMFVYAYYRSTKYYKPINPEVAIMKPEEETKSYG